MMRLLFLCLLLAAATAFSDEGEGSAVEGMDDEDVIVKNESQHKADAGSVADKTTGAESGDQLTLIIVVVVVTALALSVAAIVAVILVRRHMNNRQQGIYAVPTEQDQKGPV